MKQPRKQQYKINTRHDGGGNGDYCRLPCRARIPDNPCNAAIEKGLKAFVFSDVPILHLSLGSNLNPDDIEEGDDVYFECKVNANPWAYKVLWKHNVSRFFIILFTFFLDTVIPRPFLYRLHNFGFTVFIYFLYTWM